jgi:Domain of unknown function (DUF4148)
MNRQVLTTLIASLGLFAAFASEAAPNAAKTRAEVLQELQQSRTDGSLDLYRESEGPGSLSSKTGASTVTRMEVLLELARARQAGELDNLETRFDRIPSDSVLTRAQVKAELLEAIRLGALESGERSSAPSTEQLEQIRLAGLRALMMNVASR